MLSSIWLFVHHGLCLLINSVPQRQKKQPCCLKHAYFFFIRSFKGECVLLQFWEIRSGIKMPFQNNVEQRLEHFVSWSALVKQRNNLCLVFGKLGNRPLRERDYFILIMCWCMDGEEIKLCQSKEWNSIHLCDKLRSLPRKSDHRHAVSGNTWCYLPRLKRGMGDCLKRKRCRGVNKQTLSPKCLRSPHICAITLCDGVWQRLVIYQP